jgi:exonuclease VII small subunit
MSKEDKLKAIKEVIECIDSGKQSLENGLDEIDFIINETN